MQTKPTNPQVTYEKGLGFMLLASFVVLIMCAIKGMDSVHVILLTVSPLWFTGFVCLLVDKLMQAVMCSITAKAPTSFIEMLSNKAKELKDDRH